MLQTDSPPESRLPPDPPHQEDPGMLMAGATLQVAGCSSDQTSGLASSFKDKMKLVSVIFSDLSIAIFVQEYFNFYTLRLDFATF